MLEFRGATPPPALRDALARLQTLSGLAADLEREIGQVAVRQDELAASRPACARTWRRSRAESDLARRYLDRLGASEDELAVLAGRSDRPARRSGARGGGAARLRPLR